MNTRCRKISKTRNTTSRTINIIIKVEDIIKVTTIWEVVGLPIMATSAQATTAGEEEIKASTREVIVANNPVVAATGNRWVVIIRIGNTLTIHVCILVAWVAIKTTIAEAEVEVVIATIQIKDITKTIVDRGISNNIMFTISRITAEVAATVGNRIRER